ncbi:hypothetical protein M23134_03045 [Microscilla marina ATCC 23134]|uniref:Uncharacterized protein n=1 Tax=Microscilla marina ATCC 23134 TaxID=313606 RepID=A1ZZ89_MICM2|nr:hypothetical protein M23134_03045 [Microscilla marina ATCC 23134]
MGIAQKHSNKQLSKIKVFIVCYFQVNKRLFMLAYKVKIMELSIKKKRSL